MERPIFAEGVTAPMRLVGMKEVFHPSAGDNHSHWFYEFEPDMEQAVLQERADPTHPEDSYNGEPDLETLMNADQKAVFGPVRLGLRQPSLALCVGNLYDIILVEREPLATPELSETGLGKLLMRIFGKPDEGEDPNVVTLVPLKDLEAAEYDLPPDIEGLPDLTHVEGASWMNMTVIERLSVIAQARAEQS